MVNGTHTFSLLCFLLIIQLRLLQIITQISIIFFKPKKISTMKNLITLFAFVFGLLFTNSIFAQKQKHSTATNTQTVASNEDNIVFSDGEVNVYCSAALNKPNAYYAVNKNGKRVDVSVVDANEISPTPATTAMAKSTNISTGTTTNPPANAQSSMSKMKCVCVKKDPQTGLCQDYDCTFAPRPSPTPPTKKQ